MRMALSKGIDGMSDWLIRDLLDPDAGMVFASLIHLLYMLFALFSIYAIYVDWIRR